MNRLLQALGLMRVSEHERIVEQKDDTIDTIRTLSESRAVERDEVLAKFKKAITDLAAAREELTTAYSVMDRLNKQIIELTPDALAMRRKRERDRDRRKAVS